MAVMLSEFKPPFKYFTDPINRRHPKIPDMLDWCYDIGSRFDGWDIFTPGEDNLDLKIAFCFTNKAMFTEFTLIWM